MKTLLTALLLLTALNAYAVDIYDPQSGKYLGQLGGNPYDANSTSNPYGQYGNPYSSDSINNPYGNYGSEDSPSSPNNPYATSPPVVIDPSTGRYE